MHRPFAMAPSRHNGADGQIIVIFVLALVALLAGVALLIEGGNAYSQQRATQNGADAAANAGAAVLAQSLGGATVTDADVAAAVALASTSNGLTATTAYYTDVAGQPINAAGAVVAENQAAEVGGGPNNPTAIIPPGAQGVHDAGTRTFGTTFGNVIGFSQFTAGAEATAITGRLIGGQFLPVVFPVNIVDCEVNGDLGIGETQWVLSQPGDPPVGPEYIVPLCKTGGGSFMILDLDGTPNNCQDEVLNPPAIQFDTFPTDVESDNGNNCAKQMVDAINDLQGTVVLVPICDAACTTSGGSNAVYHIIKVAAFYVDYMSDENNPNNSQCQATTSPTYGTSVTPIRGNGSSSCLAGWFVRYITTGPVGAGTIGNTDSIGVQLIK